MNPKQAWTKSNWTQCNPSSKLFQSFFKEELKKHDQLVTYLNQNMAAQENILRAVTEANAQYAPIRKATTEAIARYVHF